MVTKRINITAAELRHLLAGFTDDILHTVGDMECEDDEMELATILGLVKRAEVSIGRMKTLILEWSSPCGIKEMKNDEES